MNDHAKRIAQLEEEMVRLIKVMTIRAEQWDKAIQTLQRNSLALASAVKGLEEALSVRSDECH